MDESKKDGQPQPLSDEEREELKAKVMHSAYKAVGTCFSQCFFLFLMCLLIAKIEGAGYSSVWIISPFLTVGGIILCCLACTIFCISEVDENAGMAEFDSTVNQAAAAAGYGTTDSTNAYQPPNQQQPSAESNRPNESTWDPEQGQTWIEPEQKQDAPQSSDNTPMDVPKTPTGDNPAIAETPTDPSFDLD
jgi:hypothetical protein